MSDIAKCPLCQQYIDTTFNQDNCPKCGGSLVGRVLKNEAANHSPYYGVGGWLLLFVVGLTILGPLINLAGIGRSLSDASKIGAMYPSIVTVVYVEAALLLLLTAFSIYAGYCLWTIKPKAVGTAKIFLIVLVIFSFVDLFLVISADFPAPAAREAIRAAVTGIFRSVIYAGVWLLYLSKSERVHATYFAED